MVHLKYSPPPILVSLILWAVLLLGACKQNNTAQKTVEELSIDSTLQKLQFLSYSNPDSVEIITNKILQQSKAADYTEGEARSYLMLCSVNSLKGLYDTSILFANLAMLKVDTLQQPKLTAEIFNEKGICYDFKADYKKALDNYNKASQYFTIAKDTAGYVRVKNNIGLIYQNNDDYIRAKSYFEDCLKLSKEKGYIDQEIMALNNLGAVENELKQPDLALKYFKQVLQYDIQSGNETYISYSYNNVGEGFTQLKNWDSATWYYKKAIELKEKLNLGVALMNSYKQYANVLIELNNFAEADKYLSKAFVIAKKSGAKDYLQQCYELQSLMALKKGDFKNAYFSKDSSTIIKDSISGAKFKTELVEKEKDHEISMAELALQKEKEKTTNARITTIIFLTLSVLLATSLVLLWLSFKKQRRMIRLQHIQQQKLEAYNKQIIAQKKLVEEGMEVKNKFLSFMAHEIRTPLGGIIGLTELLMETNPTAEQTEFLNYQKKASEHLLTLLNDVLDYQKVSSGNVEISHIRFDLKETLQQVQNLYKAALIDKNILLRLNHDINIPALLIGDPIRLNQIVGNLLSNAIKFTPTNGFIKITAKLKQLNASTATVHFIVEDSGIGIDDKNKQIIYEMYKQVNDSDKLNGTGLGLNIVKNLLELMDSSINLESELGKGSKFSFDIEFGIPA